MISESLLCFATSTNSCSAVTNFTACASQNASDTSGRATELLTAARSSERREVQPTWDLRSNGKRAAFAAQTSLLDDPSVLVATWNIAGNRGIAQSRLEQVSSALSAVAADIILLQEVRAGTLTDAVRRLLSGLGLHHSSFSADRLEKKHGVAVASRWPMRFLLRPGGRAFEPVQVETPLGIVFAISTHIPNGVGNGWRKAYAMEDLGNYIAATKGPLILGGDFNEPREFGPDLTIEPFGRGPGQTRSWDEEWTDRHGVSDRLSKWRDACRRLLAPDCDLGLRHAYLSLHPKERPVTHITTGNETRFFDHLLVRDLQVLDAGFDHGVRESCVSDHSLAWTRVGPTQTSRRRE